jgi:hypothetical protein
MSRFSEEEAGGAGKIMRDMCLQTCVSEVCVTPLLSSSITASSPGCYEKGHISRTSMVSLLRGILSWISFYVLIHM